MTTSMVAEEEADSADSPVGAVATLDAAGHVSSCRGGGSLVVFAVLYSAVARAKGTMGFPYLRTTIDCMELLPDPLLEPAATAPLPVATGIPGHWEPPRACNSSGCVPQRQPSVPRGNASAGLVPAWVGGDWDGSSDGSTPDTAGLPAEVEDVFLRHEAVREAAVFALPHPSLGEEPAAAVVLSGGGGASADELREFAAGLLAGFKVPRRVIVVDELPKGPTGKVARTTLAKRLGLIDP